MSNITKAVITAGGYATRFLPITKAVPKEMLPLGDKPVIHYILQELQDAGIT
ncbi:MAG: UTP--glucose-1-phosphate uridylyltransferase, partial [Clostridia bacterium]|nr:UTP--glucose-1-phosphate uridylyltransferase [Clostridia bacterium]